MSSTYYTLCLSHDPAIRIDREHTTAGEALASITAGIEEHPGCDLLVGRFSAALVEVACPATRDQRHTPRCLAPGGPDWASSELLRLLAAAYLSGDSAVRAATAVNAFQHWTPQRIHRLRDLLDIPGLDEDEKAERP